MIVVTGATGKLGQHVVAGLLTKLPAAQLAVAVRDPAKASALAAKGVSVRKADYSQPETLTAALAGAEKLLLISGNTLGQRLAQHTAVVKAAKQAGVKLIVYTSILHADTTPLLLAAEHKATEQLIRDSGLPFVFLRNGWYIENYTEQLASALEHGAIVGNAGAGRVAAAARSDYAAAAVAVLTSSGHENTAYELAGDKSFSMPELAAEVARHAGKPVVYEDLPKDAYRDVLVSAGLPADYANVLADADVGVSRGVLNDESGQLRKLIGRPTTSLAQVLAAKPR
jgi:NAD(P)H dehydrogenase (quinone)